MQQINFRRSLQIMRSWLKRLFIFSARIKTTATACRYNATQRNAFGVKPLFPNPQCEIVDNRLVCFWLSECGLSEIDIIVTNCGDFYLYYLHPTTIEPLLKFLPLPSAPPVYCTTETNITKGNIHYNIFFFTWGEKNVRQLRLFSFYTFKPIQVTTPLFFCASLT